MRKLIFGFVILSVGFFACTDSTILQPPKYIDDYSRNFVSILKDESIDSILSYVDKEHQTQDAKEFLLKVSSDLKFKQLKEAKIIGYKATSTWTNNQQSNKVYTTDYEFKSEDLYYVFSIAVLELDNNLSIIGFNGNKLDRPIEVINSLSISNISVSHIIFILFFLAILGFIIFSIVDITKSEIKKKWLWIIFSLIGFCGLSLNWTTGDINFKFFIIKILGVGFSKSGEASPWFISLTIPIGAIVYWIKKPGILYNQELEENLKTAK